MKKLVIALGFLTTAATGLVVNDVIAEEIGMDLQCAIAIRTQLRANGVDIEGHEWDWKNHTQFGEYLHYIHEDAEQPAMRTYCTVHKGKVFWTNDMVEVADFLTR